MKEKITKLIDVKTIVTLLLTIVFVYLHVFEKQVSQEFMTIYIMVMTFFFNKNKEQNKEGE